MAPKKNKKKKNKKKKARPPDSSFEGSLPPEADGEAEAERADVVPPARRQVQDRAGLQDALEPRRAGEQREPLRVDPFDVHLDVVPKKNRVFFF